MCAYEDERASTLFLWIQRQKKGNEVVDHEDDYVISSAYDLQSMHLASVTLRSSSPKKRSSLFQLCAPSSRSSESTSYKNNKLSSTVVLMIDTRDLGFLCCPFGTAQNTTPKVVKYSPKERWQQCVVQKGENRRVFYFWHVLHADVILLTIILTVNQFQTVSWYISPTKVFIFGFPGLLMLLSYGNAKDWVLLSRVCLELTRLK